MAEQSKNGREEDWPTAGQTVGSLNSSQPLSRIPSCDVAFQLLNLVRLTGDNPLHQVAQGNHTHHGVILSHHRKMAETVLGHDRHAVVHGVSWSHENDWRRHDFADLSL